MLTTLTNVIIRMAQRKSCSGDTRKAVLRIQRRTYYTGWNNIQRRPYCSTSALRTDMKQKVYAGHLGMNSCLRRARELIYLPGMSADIGQHVETCGTCATYSDKQPAEPPIINEIPTRPWKTVGTDVMTFGGKNYCT